jgi:hypothetical protein
MICGEIHYNKRAKISALNGLTWLLKARKSINGTKIWTVNAGNTNIEPWVEYGFSGVAFLFIKAFEIYKNPEYKEASIAVLLMHPARITSNYISQASGLAGLGEVYLEAYHVFGDIEWKNRATHIYEFFRHTSKQNFQNGYFWLDGSENKPTPEFMSGHSGILHFLLRYQNPSKIKFPLLSF